MEGTIKRFVEKQIFDEGDEREIGVDDDLLMSGLDSIGLIGLISFLEDTFDVEIPPEDVTIESFGTIANIVKYLERRSVPRG